MNSFDDLLGDLFYFALSYYEFVPMDEEQECLYKIVEDKDEKTKALIEDVMEQWQRYGFVNGFAYAMRIIKEC